MGMRFRFGNLLRKQNRWLCLIPGLRSVHHPAGSAILGIGKYRYRLMIQVITAAFNFFCILWLILTARPGQTRGVPTG